MKGSAKSHDSLPPLAEACAAFKGFLPGEHWGDRIFELLSGVIQLCRGTKPKKFYSMREVAKFFDVAVGTVQTVYRRLDHAGVLTRMRSSQTMIPARALRSRVALRGIVCMPIWLPGFIQFLDWQEWIAIIEEELSHYRFVAEPVFFQSREELKPEFINRLLKFNPDSILWFCPSRVDIPTMLSLLDTGVPLSVIQNSPGQFPGRIYPLSYEKALRQGLHEWQSSGEVRQIVVPHHQAAHFSATSILNSALATCSLPSQLKGCDHENLPALLSYLQNLTPESRTGIIFDDDLLFIRMCGWMPEATAGLFRRHRIMTMRKVRFPFPLGKGTTDTLFFSWRKLARRIALDFSQARGFIPATQPPMEATWHGRAPLSEVMKGEFDQ